MDSDEEVALAATKIATFIENNKRKNNATHSRDIIRPDIKLSVYQFLQFYLILSFLLHQI